MLLLPKKLQPVRRIAFSSVFTAVLLFILVPVPAAALADGVSLADPTKDLARIRGTVAAAETGTPLPGVAVSVANGSARTETDAFGHFNLGGLAEGTSEIRFSRLGYEAQTLQVQVTAGTTSNLIVVLEPSPLALNPVLVLMDRTRMVGDPLNLAAVPGSAHFLSRQDLESQSNVFDNIHDVLRQVPGVDVRDEEGYGLRPHIGLRGTGAERASNVTLMEDGILVAPAPYAAPAAYYFPTTGRMEAVEVRKGASQIRYGPRTLGGAVNLVSATIPDEFGWNMELGGGQDATLKGQGTVGGSSRHAGWMFQTYQIRTDGFKELQGGGDTGFRVGDYLGKLRLNTNPDASLYQEVELKVGFYDQLSNETYLGLTDADFRATPNLRYAGSQPDVMDVEQRQLRLRHFLTAGSRFDLVTDVYRSDVTRQWYKLQSVLGAGISGVLAAPQNNPHALAVLKGANSDPDALRVRANNREYYSQGVQTVAGIRIEGDAVRQNLEMGVRFHQDQEDRLQFEDGYQMVNGFMVRTSQGAPGSQANRVGEAQAWAFFLQNQMEVGQWTVTPGVRYESIELARMDFNRDDPDRVVAPRVRENSVTALIPGVGVTYALSPRTHLFGGVHKGFGPPGPGADEETQVEESVNYELGARIRRTSLGLQAAAFYSDYSNILGQSTLATGGDGTGDLFNGGAVETVGVEFSADYDPTVGRGLPVRLPVRVAYTWTQATFQSSFDSPYGPWGTVEIGDRLPYLPEHLLSAQVTLQHGPWDLTLAGNGATAMRTEAGTGPIEAGSRSDGFLVLNFSGEYRLPTGGTMFAGIQNLANQQYVVSRRPAGARPGLPRTFHAGVRVTR